jgi:alpha-tubulin suppressor-like RCC1 family protein
MRQYPTVSRTVSRPSAANRTLFTASVVLSLVACGGRSRSNEDTFAMGGASGSGGSGSGATSVAGQAASLCGEVHAPVSEPRTGGTIATNALTTCAVIDGKVACFGRGDAGQLGDGVVHSEAAESVGVVWVSGLDDAVEVHLGSSFACARRSTGGVVCWGRDYSGQLGDGTVHSGVTFIAGPEPVVGIVDAQGLAVGAAHACATLAADSARCWGEGHLGQLGDGLAHGDSDLTGVAVPVDVLDADGSPGAAITQITAGAQHSCALMSDRSVWCWGMGLYGQVGDGSFHHGFEGAGVVRKLTRVLALDDATQVSAGGSQTCALRASGRVACWGHSGLSPDTAVPVDVCGSEGAIQISTGSDHVCALLASGKVVCWGYGGGGNLGDGVEYNDQLEGSVKPVTVVGLSAVSEIAAGARQSCAKTSSGKLYCWGDGRDGALGDPSIMGSNVPIEITGLEPRAL